MTERTEPVWRLTRLTVDGTPVDLLGAEVTLEFHDGRLAGKAAINRYMGAGSIVDGRLEVGMLATTLMAGPPELMEVERTFLAAFQGPFSADEDDSSLVLDGDRATLEFTMPNEDDIMNDWLEDHPQWEIVDGGLHTERSFPDFSTAFAFATRVAMAAEKANHHPDLGVTWGKVTVDLVTHDEGGAVTDKDRDLASTIDGF